MVDNLFCMAIQGYLPIKDRQLPICKRWVKVYRTSREYKIIRENTLKSGFKRAILLNNRYLIDFFISKGPDDWNDGMAYAAEGGHKDLVEVFISKGFDNWNEGMRYAAKGDHKHFVDPFISKLNE